MAASGMVVLGITTFLPTMPSFGRRSFRVISDVIGWSLEHSNNSVGKSFAFGNMTSPPTFIELSAVYDAFVIPHLVLEWMEVFIGALLRHGMPLMQIEVYVRDRKGYVTDLGDDHSMGGLGICGGLVLECESSERLAYVALRRLRLLT